MSLAISNIREAIREYETTKDPRWRDIWAEKVRAIGRDCPETAPWAAAFEICVAYNAEQERAAATWMAERQAEMCEDPDAFATPLLQKREAMRDAIIAASNCRTFAELDTMTPAELFADDFIPKWLRRTWDGLEEAGGARTRLDRELA